MEIFTSTETIMIEKHLFHHVCSVYAKLFHLELSRKFEPTHSRNNLDLLLF